MQRLAGCVRRAQRCTRWRAPLCAHGVAAEVDECSAAYALCLGLPRALAGSSSSRPCSSAAAPTAHRGVLGACILERLPIVLPPQPSWELEYEEWRYEKLRATFKQYPKELVEPKAVDEDESKQLWQPAALGEQGADNLRSADRKPDEFVFLVVRKADGSWQFPQAAHGAGETIRQAAERALTQAASGLDVYFVGNGPVAHHAQPDSTVFFMRASYLGGALHLHKQSGVTDWAWITKAEVPRYLPQDLHGVMAQAL